MLNRIYILIFLTLFMIAANLYSGERKIYRYTDKDLECDQYEEKQCIDDKITYVRLGAGIIPSKSGMTLAPALGLGRRYELDNNAIDISINWASAESSGEAGKSSYFSIPKALYLLYLDPSCRTSLYYGGGLSLGGIKKGGKDFNGILAEFAVGYEFHRQSSVRSMIELDISQAMIGFKKEGAMPGPVLMLSLILGF